MSRRAWIAALGLAAAGSLAPAAHPVAAQEAGPLGKADLVRMLAASSYTAEEVLTIVRMNCVSFAPTQRDRRDLGRLPAGDRVLGAIDDCRRLRTSAGYERGLPRARPVSVESQATMVAARGPAAGPAVRDDLPRPRLPPPSFELVVRPDSLIVPAERPPRLKNWTEVSRLLLRTYRPADRRSGLVVLRLRVDEEGAVHRRLIKESSGDPRLDDAVLATVSAMEFEPAMSRDRRVASWTDVPIRFATP